MFEGCVVYGEGDVGEGSWVECCVEGFCRIGHEVVVVEVMRLLMSCWACFWRVGMSGAEMMRVVSSA